MSQGSKAGRCRRAPALQSFTGRHLLPPDARRALQLKPLASVERYSPTDPGTVDCWSVGVLLVGVPKAA